jgi:hypothetical protein
MKELDQASLTYSAMQLLFQKTGIENLDPYQAMAVRLTQQESWQAQPIQIGLNAHERFQALEDAVTTALLNYLIMTGRVAGIKRVVARDVTEYDPLHQYDVISSALDSLLISMAHKEIELSKETIAETLNTFFGQELRANREIT